MSLLDSSPAEALRIHSPAVDHSLPALVDPEDSSGSVSYGQLVDQVAEVAATLPDVRTGRRLVHVPLTADAASIRAYLAVLLAGHVPLVTPQRADTVITNYRPDLHLASDGGFRTASSDPQHLLHPDLALLLSTSGSTGSPKLVRLSADNVLSNADAIIASLAITPADRAITSLPLHYCYGLSVLHAQLRAGACLVLRRGSFAEPGVLETLVKARVSMIAATPYLIELLDVQGVLDADLPDLRLITQAGGALPASRVRELAVRGRTRGWSLVVMYGQTEATARMAVLPPESVTAHPDAVGWPIGGSSFRLDTTVPEATKGSEPVGELVFSGPGVMLGYAESPDDLALGRMQDELRTGDLGRIGNDGLVRIVGRRSNFVKIMGIRIDVGQVERQLSTMGLEACVTGTDQQLQVTYQASRPWSAPRVSDLVSDVSGLGPSVISVQTVEALPRLSNGKIDRPGCASRHRGDRHRGIRDWSVRRRHPADLTSVVAALTPLLGRESVNPERSFVELGGDSFCHVQASLRLGRLLGDLPTDWHHRPLRELPLLAERLPHRTLGQRIETNVLLRAAAVIMICGSHVGLFPLAGGAHVLLAIAGFTFGRYILSEPSTVQRWRRTARAALGIALPAVLVSATMLVVFGSAHWTNVVLLHWVVRPSFGNIFWFVEALLVITVATTMLLSFSRLHTAYARDPWRLAFLVTGILLVPRYLVVGFVDGPVRGLPWTVAWLFAAGIAMSTAQTWFRKVVTAAVAAIGTVGFFPVADRNLVIMLGLLLLALVPTMVVPRFVTRPVGVLAAASLHVYLVQFQTFAFFPTPTLKFAAALAAGLALWLLTTGLLRRVQLLLPLVATGQGSPDRQPDPRKERPCVDALL